jgi:hypothetical protein
MGHNQASGKHCTAAEQDGRRRSCDSTGSICLEKQEKARWGSWASTQVEFRKCDEKHRSVVPMGVGCGRREDLANQIFVGTGGGDLPGSRAFQRILSVAERRARCQTFVVKFTRSCLLGAVVALSLPLVAQEENAAGKAEVPKDLLDDPHVREELAVNEFTAPSISKLFDTLKFLMPLPIAETARKMPERMSVDRADLAIELGFLIADGFLVVQAEQLDNNTVERLATDLTRYGKALGAGDRVNRHSASLRDSAKKKDVEQLKKELAATQRDVEQELISLKDADLAHLISLGGWIRALEVSTVAVDKQFSVERARKVMREDIADYYTESVAGLEPKISERPNYLAMRDVLAGLRTEMVLEDGKVPTPEMMAEIRKQAAKLVELALQRQP